MCLSHVVNPDLTLEVGVMPSVSVTLLFLPCLVCDTAPPAVGLLHMRLPSPRIGLSLSFRSELYRQCLRESLPRLSLIPRESFPRSTLPHCMFSQHWVLHHSTGYPITALTTSEAFPFICMIILKMTH